MKKKIDFRLEKKKENDTTVVYLYGDIVDEIPKNWWTGEEEEGDFITPKNVRELFEDIETNEVELHLNSYGGSVFASVSIFNYLRTLNKSITVIIDGLAASGASLIAMSGKKLVMPKNTTMMIHRASSYAWGNCNNLRTVADTLEKLDNATVFETYRAKFKGSDEKLKELINKETWLSAEDCFNAGLCDEVRELSENPSKPSEKEIQNAVKFMNNFARLKFERGVE